MNDYILSIDNELAKEIPEKPITLLNGDYSVIMNGARFHFKGISQQEVSSSGLDQIGWSCPSSIFSNIYKLTL